jgi:hypothetical protein
VTISLSKPFPWWVGPVILVLLTVALVLVLLYARQNPGPGTGAPVRDTLGADQRQQSADYRQLQSDYKGLQRAHKDLLQEQRRMLRDQFKDKIARLECQEKLESCQCQFACVERDTQCPGYCQEWLQSLGVYY